MMGGLAYMTGLPDRPMRAGASVNDIMGGMFGVIAIQAALAERQRTGAAAYIQSALFENNVFLMAQAMMFETVTGEPSIPYSSRTCPGRSTTCSTPRTAQKLFVTIVGEEQWQASAAAFGREDWLTDPRLATSQDRVDQRGWIIPEIAEIFRQWTAGRSLRRARAARICRSRRSTSPAISSTIRTSTLPAGCSTFTMPDGRSAKTRRCRSRSTASGCKRRDPPQIGEHTREVLNDIGYLVGRDRELRGQARSP